MFQALSNWWNRDKIERERINAKFDELTKGIAQIQQEKHEIEAQKEAIVQQLEEANKELEFRREQDAADEARRNSNEPWVEIKSAEVSDTRGIQIELDWNDAFVQYLRDNGIVARDDEGVVQKWLLSLYKNLMDRLEQEVIENSDRQMINDFE